MKFSINPTLLQGLAMGSIFTLVAHTFIEKIQDHGQKSTLAEQQVLQFVEQMPELEPYENELSKAAWGYLDNLPSISLTNHFSVGDQCQAFAWHNRKTTEEIGTAIGNILTENPALADQIYNRLEAERVEREKALALPPPPYPPTPNA